MIKKRVFFYLILFLFATAVCFAEEVQKGKLSGKWITKKYGAMAGGLVLLFNTAKGAPPTNEGPLRAPDTTFEIDSGGGFSTEVSAGTYYLVTRKGTSMVGPPKDGDLYFFSVDKKGRPKTYTVKPGGMIDVGTIKEAFPYKREVKSQAGSTTIEGVIYDDQGVAVEGAIVLAYSSPEMAGNPLYVSDSTGKDGKYVLRVNEGGNYYLKIRSHYGGGKPEAGEIMGGYGEQNAPAVVRAEKGKAIKGIDIKGKRFTGRGLME